MTKGRDKKTAKNGEDGQTRLVRRLYGTRPGRAALYVLKRRWVSALAGRFMDSRLSAALIDRFIRLNGIDMSEYPESEYRSFNGFFTRRIRAEMRPIPEDGRVLMSPADGLLSVHEISADTTFDIKGQSYTMESLIKNGALAGEYEGGTLMIFRLTVSDYHRYHYPDSGSKTDNVFIPGVLNTVHPIAAEKRAIYCENQREYFVLRSENFGDILFISVGALLVGRICNNHREAYISRGQEAGYFEYGGSTVILCFKKGAARLYPGYSDMRSGEEIRVRMGEPIGVSDGLFSSKKA